MGRRVVVIASGETERRALPHLVRKLAERGIALLEVRYPPGHHGLTRDHARKLITASWFSRLPADRPDKFVVLLDADRRDPREVQASFGDVPLPEGIRAPVLVAVAKWHLEAWFLADQRAARRVAGRALGRIEETVADDIENPKLRLRSLLGVYTAEWSEAFARAVDPLVVERRSPSFSRFLEAMRNGDAADTAHMPGGDGADRLDDDG